MFRLFDSPIYPVSQELLSEFMYGFFGYGNLKAPYWFIGKEEGGGKDLKENFQRILTWELSGKTTTVDMIDYHKAMGFTDSQLSSIQPTWTKLIQILLEIEGNDSISSENRRAFQRNRLGRLDADNCCLELMPMASRSTGLWLWKDIFYEYFGLEDREQYFSQVVVQRRNKLKKLISNYKPRLIVLYSSQIDYIKQWSLIADAKNWEWVFVSKYFKYGWYQDDTTLYVITPHPTSHGLRSEDYPVAGRFIREKLLVKAA